MPEEIYLPKSLHELVSKISNDGKNRKVVGYSVSSYTGVLSALEKAKMIQAESKGISYTSPAMSITSRSWTMLSNYGIDNNANIMNNFYQSELNQVRVILRDYMPFVLDCKTDDGKIERTCVNRKDYIGYEFLNQGLSISSSQNPQFPPGEWSQSSLERCKNGTNGDGFVIGLGVAFNQVLINYFKHFYPKMNWDVDNLKSLAAKGYLYGELMIPKSGNSKVLHSKITVDVSQSNSSSYDVFVPVPLMLLRDFQELGFVKVKNNSVEEIIDGEKLKFPFADRKFNHKKSEIEGFSPDGVKEYVPGSPKRHVEYEYTGLNGGQEVYGRMRFYFSTDGEDELYSKFGGIPDDYKLKLFQGVLEEDGYYKTDTTIEYDQGLFQSGDVYWDSSYFIGTDISKEQYEKCVRIVWDFEVGNPNPDWSICENVGDNAGLSYGPYQYTEKSGLLSQVLRLYLDMKSGSLDENDKIISESEISSGNYKGTKYSSNTKIINALKAIGNDQIMKNAQGKIFLENRAKIAISCMKETNMKSALGLQMWMYYINHGWSTNYKAPVKNAIDEKSKCNALANAHERRLQTLDNWDKFKNGWVAFINAHRRAINANNFNLDIPQKWRNYTV